MTLKPVHLHTCWLIANNAKNSDGLLPEEIAQALSTTRNSKLFDESLNLCTDLAWIEQTAEGVRITKEGEKAIKRHWKFYKPTEKNVRALLSEHKLLDVLLDETEEKKKPKVLDLFCGVGGLSLGFETAGFRSSVAIDNDPEACEAHELNFPHCKVLNADINEIAADPIAKLMELTGTNEFDGVIGGPPCQGFSNMGERSVTDDRSFLTTRFAEIVLKLKPKFFLIENVPGLQKIGAKKEFLSWAANFSSPIGLYATELSDQVPFTPKSLGKRDRQFRKRLVSSIVKEMFETLQSDLFAPSRPLEEQFLAGKEYFFTAVDKTFAAKSFAAEEDWAVKAKDILLRAEELIDKIVWSSLIRVALSRKLNQSAKTKFQTLIEDYSYQHPDSYYAHLLAQHSDEPGMSSYNKLEVGPVLQSLLKKMDGEYEIFGPKVLVATDFGAPQTRKRLFIVGIRLDVGRKFEFPLPSHSTTSDAKSLEPTPTCLDAIDDLPKVDNFESLLSQDVFSTVHLDAPSSAFQEEARLLGCAPSDQTLPRLDWNPFIVDASKRTVHAPHVIERLEATKEGIQDSTSGKTRLKADGYSVTLRAGTREGKGSHTAVRPIHYEQNRVVTVREGARLMGFPDWIKLHETKWHGFRLVGNAVPKHFGQAIAKSILDCIREE